DECSDSFSVGGLPVEPTFHVRGAALLSAFEYVGSNLPGFLQLRLKPVVDVLLGLVEN
ncbi:MAG: hypothetical protein GWN30_20650, partial [Gammaproteobacteria bacterium]|nr:hypothetical protein [Gammaproteobacteria bacterium]